LVTRHYSESIRRTRHVTARVQSACSSLLLGLALVAMTNGQGLGAVTDSARYRALKSRILNEKESLVVRFARTSDSTGRSGIEAEATGRLRAWLVDSILPVWSGTPWDYNGTTQIPGLGQIACGYFVTTCLRDVGFDLARVRLSQQPAETIIGAFVQPTLRRRWSSAPIDGFVKDVLAMGQGVYLVGLDNHIGFLVVDTGTVVFWHVSYVPPSMVISEDALQSPVLSASRYRVVGRIIPNKVSIRRWLRGERFDQ
jgi:hypothetical protein